MNLDIFPICIKRADSRENLLFAYFYGLCILISFSLLTITVQGVSNKHCLLPFFHFKHTFDTFSNSNREIWNFWSGNLCLVSGGFHVANFGSFFTEVKDAKSSDIARNMLQSNTMSTYYYANRSENMRLFTV